jgi:hypothetical protein
VQQRQRAGRARQERQHAQQCIPHAARKRILSPALIQSPCYHLLGAHLCSTAPNGLPAGLHAGLTGSHPLLDHVCVVCVRSQLGMTYSMCR